jgi:hypothetical protein
VKALVWVLVLLLAVLIEAEVIAWCHPVQRWLIRRVAASLPRQHRDRYTEEWYRECEEIPNGPVTRLLWILSLLFRRRSVARALRQPRTLAFRRSSLTAEGPELLFRTDGSIVFTGAYVEHRSLSKKMYGQGTQGVITNIHTGPLGGVTHVDVRLPNGEFVREVPVDYFLA